MAMILDKRATAPALDIACRSAVYAAEGKTKFRFATTRFGAVEAEEDLVITLPDGLIGFENCKRFVVLRPAEDSAFRWLQALEEPAVAFPIVEPVEFRPDYAPTISDSDARSLGLSAETPKLLFAIVTVPAHDPRAMTANLLGPIVINGETRQGRQVIVQDEGYTTKHTIVDELLRMATVSTPTAAPSGGLSAKARRPRKSAQAA